MTGHKTNARTWRINDERKKGGKSEKETRERRRENRGGILTVRKPLTNERVLYRPEVILIRWLPSPSRLNFNVATGSFFNWIFNWDDSRYINPSSPRSTLCLLLLLFLTTPCLLAFSLLLSRRFSLGAAFFTADYVCGYRGSLVFLAANSLPWFTDAR